jgi:hypothetical protein
MLIFNHDALYLIKVRASPHMGINWPKPLGNAVSVNQVSALMAKVAVIEWVINSLSI